MMIFLSLPREVMWWVAFWKSSRSCPAMHRGEQAVPSLPALIGRCLNGKGDIKTIETDLLFVG
jgi:hypothetical protein